MVDREPLRLEAMTLRGLGSYLRGGRLDIRPLTILCGTNGSGKSTWFRMLKLLRKSHDENRLPFAFRDDLDSGEAAFHDYTNAFVKFEPERHEALTSPEEDREYGRLGTVGLHVAADSEFVLDGVARIPTPGELAGVPFDPQSAPQSFLWGGHCRRGMRFRVRISDPTGEPFESRVPGYVELAIDDLFIRFERDSTHGGFKASCSRAFWPWCGPHDRTELEVGSFLLSGNRPVDVRGPEGQDSFDLQVGFCEIATARIRQLLDIVLRGVFWLGAIRQVQRAGYVDEETLQDADIFRGRTVGEEGQHTHALARRFAFNLMSPDPEPGPGRVSYRYPSVHGSFLGRITDKYVQSIQPLALKLWRGIDDETQRRIRGLFIFSTEETGRLATRLLNEALSRRDLYDPSLSSLLGEESRGLLGLGIDRLDESDLERFNRLLIDAAFPDDVSIHTGSIFESYYAAWLGKLLGTRPYGLGCAQGECAAHYWDDPEHPPCGFLDQLCPDDERSKGFANGVERGDLNRYKSPLFGEKGVWAAPANMSSGFHQVAPMIVQAGLMRAGEVLCIENPEAHLHPSLQLEVAEFLIRQAKAGRIILVETHSDLVVRRVVRAILEEEIKQEAVRVHFTDVDADSPLAKDLGYASSSIAAIEIDREGRIRNWPTGFMDADIRESRRLLDAMYGATGPDKGLDDNVEEREAV